MTSSSTESKMSASQSPESSDDGASRFTAGAPGAVIESEKETLRIRRAASNAGAPGRRKPEDANQGRCGKLEREVSPTLRRQAPSDGVRHTPARAFVSRRVHGNLVNNSDENVVSREGLTIQCD